VEIADIGMSSTLPVVVSPGCKVEMIVFSSEPIPPSGPHGRGDLLIMWDRDQAEIPCRGAITTGGLAHETEG
jgi:hypothetical protein